MKRVKNYALKPFRVNMSNESLDIYRNNGHILPKIWVKILRSGVQWPHKKYSEIVLTTVLMPLYPTVCSENWKKSAVLIPLYTVL